MKKLIVVAAILSVMNFSGCSWSEIRQGETKPQISYVNFKNPDNAKIDNAGKPINGTTIFVWSPNNNAAVLNQEGKGCVQGADVFNTKDSNINIGNDILKLFKGAIPSGENNKLIATEITNKIIQLKTNTERNTYLSLGMFGLCQLHVSGDLSQAELAVLVGQLIKTSAEIGLSNPAKPIAESPEVISSNEAK